MRVLLVVHGFPPWAMGGTEIYTHDFAHALKRCTGDELFVLTREADPSRPDYDVRREDREGLRLTIVNNLFRSCRSFEDTYRNPPIRRIVASLLDEIRPDIVHVQHLTCLSTDLVTECASRGTPTIFTLNDYWLICHRGQLLDLDYRRCDGPDPDGCGRCIGVAGTANGMAYRAVQVLRGVERRLPSAPARFLRRAVSATTRIADQGARSTDESAKRTEHMRLVCGQVTRFLAPSHTLRRRFIEFGISESRITYQAQGIDQTHFERQTRTRDDRLRIGFLGSLQVSKAPHLVLEAFAALPRGAASLRLLGSFVPYHGDDRYRNQLEPLLQLPAVIHSGTVDHDKVAEALGSLDVVVVPSVWIENAPFVIREAFCAGVPVIASNIGGMAEMIEHGSNGLLFEAGNAADLHRALVRLLDEPALLETLRRGIPRVPTLEDDVAWTRALYREVISAGTADSERVTHVDTASRTEQGPRVSAVLLNFRTPDEVILSVRALQASRRRIDDLLVVDNGSNDESAERVRRALPDVATVETHTNLGFSGGCNVGIRRALDRGAEQLLLVNSDVILAPDALQHLQETMQAEKELGIVGPVLLSRSHPSQVSSLGIAFSAATGRMRHHGFGHAFDPTALPPSRRVDAVSGCVMLIRRDVFERIGLLDERYFFSFEDIDFCLRARQAGFETAVAHRALAYHEGSVSIGRRSPRRLYFATRNHLLVAEQALPQTPGAAALRAASIVVLNVAFALRSSEMSKFASLRHVALGLWHHIRRRYGDGP